LRSRWAVLALVVVARIAMAAQFQSKGGVSVYGLGRFPVTLC
jgi:hypothetical protein